jgi:hypothetical protein
MGKLPLYHQTPQGAAPKWWLVAPAIAFAYTLLAPRYVPDIVTVADPLANVTRWLVGLVVGVVVLTVWRLTRWVRAER